MVLCVGCILDIAFALLSARMALDVSSSTRCALGYLMIISDEASAPKHMKCFVTVCRVLLYRVITTVLGDATCYVYSCMHTPPVCFGNLPACHSMCLFIYMFACLSVCLHPSFAYCPTFTRDVTRLLVAARATLLVVLLTVR